jgi:hypothetical protein
MTLLTTLIIMTILKTLNMGDITIMPLIITDFTYKWLYI